MTILTAIKLAIKNGYKHQVFNLETMIKDDMLDPDTVNSILLNRNFWIAFDEGLEYHESGGIKVMKTGRHKCNEKCKNTIGWYGGWKYMWEKLIDHLASDKSIQSFFESLEEPK